MMEELLQEQWCSFFSESERDMMMCMHKISDPVLNQVRGFFLSIDI